MIPIYSCSNHVAMPEHMYLSWLPIKTPLIHSYETIPTYLKRACQRVSPGDRRREYLNARLLLHEMVDQLGLPIVNFNIQQDVRGKLLGLAEPQAVYLSLSRTQRYQFALISTSVEVGLDAEPMHRWVHPGLRSRMMCEAELNSTSFSNLSDLQTWVIKESVLKLTGDGLRVAMKNVLLQSAQTPLITSYLQDMAIQTWFLEFEAHYVAISTYLQKSLEDK